jgi:hypothetical protein
MLMNLVEIHSSGRPRFVQITIDFPIFAIHTSATMSLITHLNAVASALHHRSATILQQQFSLSQSSVLTTLVFDTSLEKGTLDIRRAITPIDINWGEALAQRWRAAVALWREGDIATACTAMGACVS